MNRRTRMLVSVVRHLPRPDPPSERYLRGVRRELPPRLARVLLGPVAPEVTITDQAVALTDAELRVRVYRPEEAGTGGEPVPLVVNFHGGGFVFGNLTSSDWLCGNLAGRTGALVASVDYRLAPEHPAPIPFRDSWAATQWLVEHARELGADPGQVTVMGESAGGNLAALVALASRDRTRNDPAWPRLARQVLIYPATDLTLTSASALDQLEAPLLPRSTLDWYGRCYIPQGRPDSIALDDPRVSPLHAPDHTDVAPALVFAAGLDPLYDDAVRYVDRLRTCGVDAELVTYPDAIHGFVSLPLLERAAHQALDVIVDRLRA